jgi:hypothetical protein
VCCRPKISSTDSWFWEIHIRRSSYAKQHNLAVNLVNPCDQRIRTRLYRTSALQFTGGSYHIVIFAAPFSRAEKIVAVGWTNSGRIHIHHQPVPISNFFVWYGQMYYYCIPIHRIHQSFSLQNQLHASPFRLNKDSYSPVYNTFFVTKIIEYLVFQEVNVFFNWLDLRTYILSVFVSPKCLL